MSRIFGVKVFSNFGFALYFLVTIASIGFSASPSFKCGPMNLYAESLICSDAYLSELDQKLAHSYRDLSAHLSKKAMAGVVNDQKKWLTNRNACADGLVFEDKKSVRTAIKCINTAYDSRLIELDSLAGNNSRTTEGALTTVNSEVYRDEKYGFAIRYPKSMRIEKEFRGYYHIQNGVWRQGTNSVGIPVIAIVYRPNGNNAYPGIEVRIGVRSGKTISDACGENSNDGMDMGYAGKKVIDGNEFEVADISTAGMSQYVNGFSYQAFHGGYCYSIERFVTGSGADEGEDDSKRKRAAAIEESSYALTEKIVDSFRFLEK